MALGVTTFSSLAFPSPRLSPPFPRRLNPRRAFPLASPDGRRPRRHAVAFCSLEDSSSRRRGPGKGNLLQAAGSIGLMTAFSKGLGFLRETLLAAVFGVGPVITAFNYSSVLPGFFLTIFGGINGPLQITTMSLLSKYGRKEGQTILGKISTFIVLVTGVVSATLFFFTSNIIDAIAPGLLMECSKSGSITRDLAILQLRIMAPCAILAGLIGVGFGTLRYVFIKMVKHHFKIDGEGVMLCFVDKQEICIRLLAFTVGLFTAGVYDVLTLSPSLSSLSIIVVVIMYTTFHGIYNRSFGNSTMGAVSLASGVVIGAFCQLLWQARAHYDLGFPFLRFQSVNPFMDKDIHEISMVLFPAILGSSMLQLATLTDLYFASFLPGAAAGLGYANLLVMAPLGILSSSIILPMISLFARFLEPPDFAELKDRLSESLLLALVTSLSMTAIVLPLSKPIVEVALQRLSFSASASIMVSSILSYYIAGSAVYLVREIFIQLFYILGDGKTPFCISIAAIAINALLDWIFIRAFSLGPEGLVLATTLVHAVSIVALVAILNLKLDGLPLQKWLYFCCITIGASIISGGATELAYKWGYGALLQLRVSLMVKVWSILFAGCVSLLTFCLVLCIFGQTEIQTLKRLFNLQVQNQT